MNVFFSGGTSSCHDIVWHSVGWYLLKLGIYSAHGGEVTVCTRLVLSASHAILTLLLSAVTEFISFACQCIIMLRVWSAPVLTSARTVRGSFLGVFCTAAFLKCDNLTHFEEIFLRPFSSCGILRRWTVWGVMWMPSLKIPFLTTSAQGHMTK